MNPEASPTPPAAGACAADRLLVVGSFVQASCWRVAELPRADESQLARDYTQEPAGKGLAVAVASHRLGSPVDLLLAVGEDAAGDALLRQLAEEGLDPGLVQRHPGHSGQGAGLIDARGGTLIAVHPGANARLDPAASPGLPAALARARLAYGQLEAPLDAVARVLGEARRHGALTVLNPSPWQTLPQALLDDTDLLVVNRREAAALLDSPLDEDGGPDALRAGLARRLPALWRRWPGRCLVATLGPMGCVAFERSGAQHDCAPHPVAGAHAIGAGDAFSAGLCHALRQGLALPRALAWGNACGALAADRPGILASLPRADEVRACLSPAA